MPADTLWTKYAIKKIGQPRFVALAAVAVGLYLTSGRVGSEPLRPSGQSVQGRTLTEWGITLRDSGRYLASLQVLSQALRLEHASQDRNGEINTLLVLGDVSARLGRNAPARNLERQALQMARQAKDRQREASALILIGQTEIALSRFPLAVAALQKAKQITQTVHQPVIEAEALGSLADAANQLGQPEQAFALTQQALVLLGPTQTHEALRVRGNVLASQGNGYLLMGRYDQAIRLHQQSLQIARTAGDVQLIADDLLALGDDETGQSNFTDALGFLQQALPREQKLQAAPSAVLTLGSIGAVYLDLGDFAKARHYYQAALQAAAEIHDLQSKAAYLNGMGRASRYLKRYPEAIADYRKAAALARPLHLNDVLDSTLANLGEAYWLMGQYGKATAFLQQALGLAQRSADLETQQWALVNQGNVFYDQHRYTAAESYFQRALAVTRRTGTQRAAGYCLYRLMLAEKAQAHPGLAVFYGKQAVNIWQQIRRGLSSLDLGTRKSFLVSKEDTYRQLAALLIDQGRLPEAQQVLDLLKTQEFSDFVRGNAPGTTGASGQTDMTPEEDGAAKQYAQIAGQVTALGERKQALLDKKQGRAGTTFSAADQAQFDQTNEDLRAANVHLRAFLSQLAGTFQAPTAENLPVLERLQSIKNAFGLQNTLRRLHEQGQDAVVLETMLTPDRYAVIVTTAQSQKVEQVSITAADLNRKLLLFRQALQDPDSDPRAPAQELYRILVAPIEEDLKQANAHTLMWSLDGPLRYIPIAALHDGHQYLAERYVNEVFTLGSQSGFGQEDHAAWQGLGMGVSLPQPGSGFEPLPAVPDELHGIIRDKAHALGVVPGEVLLNADFSRTAMEHALEEQKYNLVHIASHFAVKPGDSDRSYLLLGDGGHLSLTQLAGAAQVFQGVDILTLSACNTAIGRSGADGKEVDSLGTIAQQQGAATVVASLWPVSDVSTMLLMSQFYHWREGHPQDSKAEALRQAQLLVMRGAVAPPAAYPVRGPRTRSGEPMVGPAPNLPPFTPVPNAPFAHPFYWATFVLFGDWR